MTAAAFREQHNCKLKPASEMWQGMNLSSNGRSERVKIAMIKTCSCNYLNLSCKKTGDANLYSVSFIYVTVPAISRFFDHHSDHRDAEHCLHLQCGNTVWRHFLY